jgi:pimeloyl-ACP methyl ester carboxylesterase
MPQTGITFIRGIGTWYRVLAPDLLGHGDSDKPRADYSLSGFAVGLRDLVDALAISRATLVRHSLGGGIAMQFAYQHGVQAARREIGAVVSPRD